MKNKFFAFAALAAILLMVFLSFVQADNIYSQNYSVTNSGQPVSAKFVIQGLKYEPYPVNPGDYFDLWVQVQNIGQSDATNAQFQLENSYPFSSDNSSANYGLIPGTINAYNLKAPGDATIQANQIVIKFRVKVADDAPEGVQNLQIMTSATGLSTGALAYNIPITIAKTKADFDIKLSDLTPQETSIIVTNIGDNSAGSVVVDAETQDGISILKGYQPASLGNMNSGQFTIAHLDAVPTANAQSMKLKISYTDTNGVRSSVEKTLILDKSQLQNISVQSSDNSNTWVYGAIGFITGVFGAVIVSLVLQKKKASKLTSKHK